MDSLMMGLASSLLEEPQEPKVERHRQSKDAAPDNSGTSRPVDVCGKGRLNESTSNNDPILQSNHKIFLSHSGAQKDFVEQLCKDLEQRRRFPFFDRRPSCLPKGERFPELILKAAQQCQMAVVVVSEEYFESKWPMIELHQFVQARLRSNTKLKILPLFYGLSVREFHNPTRRGKWFSKWEDWAKIDTRININEWKKSLKVMASFNGIEYIRDSRGVEAYRENIVSNICKEVACDIKWDDSFVKGRSNTCKAIREIIQHIQPSEKYKVCLVGFYGVGGIGKTTICKTLCNELSQEFDGKVCYVELGSKSSGDLLKEVLEHLTNTSQELLQQLNEGECKNILIEDLCKQRTFLIVDNVWDDSKSIEQAKVYLEVGFHDGSVVMVTSRSLGTLKHLGINESNCFEVPELGHEDAKKLFLHHAAHGVHFLEDEDEDAIEECVALCYYSKGDKGGNHYLPLALKALGMQLAYVGNEPREWLKTLHKVKDFDYLQEEHNPVFGILRSSFDRLQEPMDQSLFMDVVLFAPCELPMEWLSLVYSQNLKEIESRLRRLKERGLLEDVNMTSQRISVHDLYREFAKLESKWKLNKAADFKKRRWVYYENTSPSDLKNKPSYNCWENLIRVGIFESEDGYRHDNVQSLQGIKWKYCSNLVVLKLVGLEKFRGDLNLKGLSCLRSLELYEVNHLDRLDGLEDLESLTYFRWVRYGCMDISVPTHMGKLPSSLKVLRLRIGVFLRGDVFVHCTNLSKLELEGCAAEYLDFSNCTSLQSVRLSWLRLLKMLLGLTAATSSSLQYLQIYECGELVGIPGLGDLVGLQSLHLYANRKFKKLPDLQKLTRLQVLNIHEMEIAGLGYLRELQELTCRDLPCSVELPNLSGFDQLRVVNFSGCTNLSSLEDVVEDLPALRSFYLRDCESLSRLPDLSQLWNLRELDLTGSGIELLEEDISRLAILPLLQPVKVGSFWWDSLHLDVVRRKVLKWASESSCDDFPPQSWLEWTKCEERDMEMLPIKVKDIGGKTRSNRISISSKDIWSRLVRPGNGLRLHSRNL